MKKIRITYTDGTSEEFRYCGYPVNRDGVLSFELDERGRTHRNFPLASLRSWEDIA